MIKGNERKCIDCEVPMRKKFIQYKGAELETRECPGCKDRIFTEDLATKAISKLEAKRMEEEYVKHPIKIGGSWGITFPKEVSKVFGLSNSKVKLKLHPNVEKGKIETSVS